MSENQVDFTSPVVKYKEVASKDIEVRGNDAYSIYGLGYDVLFASGKAEIRNEAKAPLSEIGASIAEHYAQGKVRIYGYTDAVGSAADNQELSMQRAEAVKNYLAQNCNIAGSRISTAGEGETQPVAANDNAKGRQQNRRVRIVAMK